MEIQPGERNLKSTDAAAKNKGHKPTDDQFAAILKKSIESTSKTGAVSRKAATLRNAPEVFAGLSIVDSYKNSQCFEYNNIRMNTMCSISEESKLVIASNLTVAAILRDILILQTGEKPLKDPDEFIVDKFKSISGLLFSEDSNE